MDFHFDKVYAVTGENYPDALTGSALAALSKSPLILATYNKAGITNQTINSRIGNIIVLGGEGALSTTEVIPRYGSPIEAAQALQTTRRQQWSSMLSSIGGQIYPKLEEHQRLMQRERNIMGQLQQMGYPVRPLTFK